MSLHFLSNLIGNDLLYCNHQRFVNPLAAGFLLEK